MNKFMWTQKLVLSLAAITLSCNVYARRGEHDTDANDDGGMIVCTDQTNNSKVLQFNSVAKQGQAETDMFSLLVKVRGADDIGEVSITDKRSGDSVKTKHLEELMKITIISDEDPSSPAIQEFNTHQGAASAELANPKSGDSVKVESLNHRGQSRISVIFATDENPNAPISILCTKQR